MTQEIVYETIKDLLPEIEQELRQQVNLELQHEYAEQFKQQIESFQEIDIEALRMDLEAQLRADYQRQKEQLADQIIREFDDQFSNGQMEDKLREKIKEELDEQVAIEVTRKQKEIKLQFKKKLEQDKANLLKGFEMEWKIKVEGERKKLDKEKSEIARLKAVENVKLKKLHDNKKQYQTMLNEQKQKYQDVISSLQKQIQNLTQQLEQALQQQAQDVQTSSVLFQFQPDENTNTLNTQKPLYVHQEMNESYSLDMPFQKIQSSIQRPQTQNKPQQQSKYVEYLQNAPQIQNAKPITKEYLQPVSKKEDRIKQVKDLSRQVVNETIQYEKYEKHFIENDLDNARNKQMKFTRIKMIKRYQDDQKMQTQYLATQLNFMNEFIQSNGPDDIRYQLQELFNSWEQWKVSYGYRIEQIQKFKQEDMIPNINQQRLLLKQTESKLKFWVDRNRYKQEIMPNFTTYQRQQFDQLLENNEHIKGINIQSMGSSINEWLNLDEWEKEYLEREELKQQILSKIQSRFI